MHDQTKNYYNRRTCVRDRDELKALRRATCQMPVYQREVLRPQTNSANEEKDEEECVPGKRFHFDSASEQCVEVDYQGCFGTGNLFSTFERCEEVCIEDEGMKRQNIYNFILIIFLQVEIGIFSFFQNFPTST